MKMNTGLTDSTAKGDSLGQRELHEVSAAKRGYMLGLLTLIWALSFLDRNVLSIVLDPVKKEFHLTDTMLGAMVGLGFALVYLILSVPVARFVDRKPRVPVLVIGLTAWSILTALGGAARNALQLLVFRMGVGVGESTSTAPALSLIGDLFPKDKRPLATSIYGMAPSIGLYFGYMIGGLATFYYGWRSAFLFAGIPGIVVAGLLLFTVKEPARGLSDGPRVDTKFYRLGETIRFFRTDKTLLLVLAGACLTAYTNFAGVAWNPTFYRRVHHLNMAQVGIIVGSVIGMSGIVGGLIAGIVTTRVSKGRDEWKTLVPGIMLILACPLLLMQYLAASLPVALTFMFIAGFLPSAANGLQFSIVQTVVKVRMRALASSLHFMCANLFGMALAPLIIGLANDTLKGQFGDLSVRYSMLSTAPSALLAGLFLVWGAKYIKGDITRAVEEGMTATRVTASA